MTKSHAVPNHLHPEAVALIDLPATVRANYIRNTKHFQESTDIQADLMSLETIMNQGRGKRRRNVRLMGAPGLGKSAILEYLELRHPPYLIPGTSIYSRPVVNLSMTGISSAEEFCDYVEDRLGIPRSKQRKKPLGRMQNAVEHLNKVHCELLALDEFQDLMKVRASIRSHIVQLVKLIANEATFPLCVAGSEESLSVLEDCRHMKARFRAKVERRPWTDNEAFLTWLFGLVSRYPLKNPSKIFDAKSLRQIIARSEGNTEVIAYAAKECAATAVSSGSETIDRKMLYTLLLG